jgi:hypothetical protein
MAIRNPFKTIDKSRDKGSAGGIVDHGLGEAYEVVEFVKNNIELIFTLGSMADDLKLIADNVENFGDYALVGHDHDDLYALTAHEHFGYAPVEHTHEGMATQDHDHDTQYQPIGAYAAADHNHDADYVHIGDVGMANGVAPLDGSGLIPTSHLPALAISKPTVVANEAAQLALTAEMGDVAIRTDIKKNFVHNGGTAGTMSDWSELQQATDLVTSVNGMQGTVVLGKGDVGLGNVDNTSDANKPVSTAQAAAIALKLDASQKGVANGVAALGSDGKVPSEQLPASTGGTGGGAREVTVALVNPSFESGGTGWTLTSMSVTGSNPTGHTISPRTGSGVAVADAVANAYASQIVTLDAEDYTDIDKGDVAGSFEAYASQTFTIPERAHYTVSFLDAGDVDLGGALTTTYEGSAQNSWSKMLLEGTLPVGTRKLKFELRAERLDGSNNNMAFDDVAATYTVPAAFVSEAPKDGKQYARKDGDWAEVLASGGGSGGPPLVESSFTPKAHSTQNGGSKVVPYTADNDPDELLDATGNFFKPSKEGFYYVHPVLTAGSIRGIFIYKNGASYDGYTGGIVGATYSVSSASLVYCDGVNDYFDVRSHANGVYSLSTGESPLRIVGPFQSSSGGGGGAGEPVEIELTREYSVQNAGDAFIDLPLDGFNATEFDIVVHGTPSVDAAIYARLSNDNCATQLSGAADYKNRASNSDSKINLVSQTVGSGRPYIAEFRLAGMNGGATPKNFMLSGTGFDVNNSGGGTSFVIGGYPNALVADDYNGIRIYVSAGNMDGMKVVLTPRVKTISASIPAGTTAIEASNTELWTGTAADKFISPARMVAASVPVDLTDGATITPDFTTGINFKVTLAGNRTLENPINAQPGDSGIIILTQDGTGARTLSYGTNWRFPGGAAAGGVLSTSPNAVDLLTYFVRADGTIIATLTKDLKA